MSRTAVGSGQSFGDQSPAERSSVIAAEVEHLKHARANGLAGLSEQGGRTSP